MMELEKQQHSKFFTKFFPFLAPFFVLLGLSYSFSLQSRHVAMQSMENYVNFTIAGHDYDDYVRFRTAWRPRVFSNYLGSACFALFTSVDAEQEAQIQGFKKTVRVWSFTWFMLIGLVFLISNRPTSLFFIFGIFCALIYGFSTTRIRFYPWDLPAVFFYCSVMCLMLHSRYRSVIIMTVIGMGFKETAILLSLLFFSAPLSLKKQIIYTSTSIALCVVLKIIIDIMFKLPIPFFTVEHKQLDNSGPLLFKNLRIMFQYFGGIVFLNGGILIALLFIPFYKSEYRVYAIITFLFCAAIFVFGQIREHRIFLEVAPLCLKCLYDYCMPQVASDCDIHASTAPPTLTALKEDLQEDAEQETNATQPERSSA